MFVTQNYAEKFIGPPFGREQFWGRVELAYDDVWFYVSTCYSKMDREILHYHLLTKPSDLVELIEETRDNFWIERVMIVTPPWMNGTESWQMCQLRELIAATDKSDPLSIDYVYQFTNELCYATRDIDVINSFSWHQILYSEEKHAYPCGN